MTVAELDPVMESEEGFQVPYHVVLTTYISYGVLFLIGTMRDAYRHSVARFFSRKQGLKVCWFVLFTLQSSRLQIT